MRFITSIEDTFKVKTWLGLWNVCWTSMLVYQKCISTGTRITMLPKIHLRIANEEKGSMILQTLLNLKAISARGWMIKARLTTHKDPLIISRSNIVVMNKDSIIITNSRSISITSINLYNNSTSNINLSTTNRIASSSTHFNSSIWMDSLHSEILTSVKATVVIRKNQRWCLIWVDFNNSDRMQAGLCKV